MSRSILFSSILAVLVIVLSAGVMLKTNRREETHERFWMQSGLIFTILRIAIASSAASLAWMFLKEPYEGQASDASVLVVIGAASLICGYIFASYKVVLGATKVQCGVFFPKIVEYASISEVFDIRNQGDPRILLRVDRKRIGIWSNISRNDELLSIILARSNCKITVLK